MGATPNPQHAAIQMLTELWYILVNQDHHKDRDCHWWIEIVWSYGDQPVFRIRHNGYVHREVQIECASLAAAEQQLVRELMTAFKEEFEIAFASDWDGDPGKEAVRKLKPQYEAITLHCG